MGFFRLKPLILAFGLLLVSTAVHAADVCEITKLESGSLGSRGWAVSFPDGRSFRVIGHVHGERQYQAQILGALNDPSLSDAEVASRVQPQKQSLEKALEHFKQDYDYLAGELAAETNPTVLWVEASDGFLRDHQARLGRALQLRKSALREEMLLASASPILYYGARNALPKSVEIKGVEDINDDIRRGWLTANKLREGTLSFTQINASHPAAIKAIEPLIQEWNEAVQLVKKDQLYRHDFSKIDAVVAGLRLPAEVDRSLKNRLKAFFLDQMTSLKRDEQNVRRMIAENKSGIFMVGMLHLQPSLYLLKEKCEAMARSSSQTGAPLNSTTVAQ